MTTDDLIYKFTSLNDDYLTEKEINRSHKFIDTLKNDYICPPNTSRFKNEFNGFANYIVSLSDKIIKRKTIPNWYINNKI